jgi:hypothetical protein
VSLPATSTAPAPATAPATAKRAGAAAYLANRPLFYLSALCYLSVWAAFVPLDWMLASVPSSSLLAQLAPRATVSGMYGWFVLLPATLAFLGIGFPALFGLLREPGSQAPQLLALTALVVVVILVPGTISLLALLAAGVVAGRAMGPAGFEAGGRRVTTFAILASGAMAGLVYLALPALRGEDPGFAVAPTATLGFLFFGFLTVLASLYRTLYRAMSAGNVEAQQASVVALATVALLLWPLVALYSSAGPTVELVSGAATGVLFIVVGFLSRVRVVKDVS